jgi:transcriptional regulator with XRE-family HTH domain
MARAGIGLGVRDLARLAGVSPNTITRFERGEKLQQRTIRAIRESLEKVDAEFIGNYGVRIKHKK